MPEFESTIVQSDTKVSDALKKIGLSKEFVRNVAMAAAAARAEAITVVDPSSAPGLLSYIYGVRAIRLNLLQQGWRVSRVGNVESTVNDELGIQLCFQNVDVACSETKIPYAISGKGSASRELVNAGQRDMFDYLNERSPSQYGSTPTVWVLCVAVDESSVRAEVSCPASFKGSQFEDFHPRIFVVDESFDLVPDHARLDTQDFDDFDVEISKK